ncbi:MAG: hypothetical protein QF704_16930 [Anaerolineales bacterium]|nr:hypothetical protein [Anaerolineales bacterium]
MSELHKNNQRVRDIIDTIKVLRKEVEVLTARKRPAGTGHIITAIGVINGRIDELVKEITAPYFEEDGYEDDMKQKYGRAVLTVDDKPNAVRDAYLHSSKVKEVEHTEEYYDTERNLPFNTLV